MSCRVTVGSSVLPEILLEGSGLELDTQDSVVRQGAYNTIQWSRKMKFRGGGGKTLDTGHSRPARVICISTHDAMNVYMCYVGNEALILYEVKDTLISMVFTIPGKCVRCVSVLNCRSCSSLKEIKV